MTIEVDDFIAARWFYPGRVRKTRLIVLHATQSPEQVGAARATAHFFANESAANKSSAHVVVDAFETIGCVKPEDTAFAVPNANADGYSIEQVGYSEQSPIDWDDTYSRAVIANAARVGRQAADHFGIPLNWLSDDALRSGVAGFTDHATCSRVLGGGSHWDPGPNYPHDHYMDLVRNGPGEDYEMTKEQLDAILMMLADIQKKVTDVQARVMKPDERVAMFDPQYGMYKKVVDVQTDVTAIKKKVGA